MPLSLAQKLSGYLHHHPGEADVVARFRTLLDEGPLVFSRENRAAHLTASAWVVDAPLGSVLLLHHKKLARWLQPGGHADGDTDLVAVARREVVEETGIEVEEPLFDTIFDLDIHEIPARGNEAAHLHYDVRYVFQAHHGALPLRNHESNSVAWIPLNELHLRTDCPSVLRMRGKWEGMRPRVVAER